MAHDVRTAYHEDLVLGGIVERGGEAGDLGGRRDAFHDRTGIDAVSGGTARAQGGDRGMVLVALVRTEGIAGGEGAVHVFALSVARKAYGRGHS
ncbi:hypothetical protein AB0J43_07655 [Nonomuraea fuscirosea]